MDGVVVVDKPEGLTSHDVVAAVRRLLPKGTRVGHTGTLDPFATGVLPLVIGKATRLARFLSGDDKRYLATVAFGVGTTTCDRTGEPVETADAGAVRSLTDTRVAEALARFVGTRPQVPPVYSAKKIDGQRAYDRARRGDATPPPPAVVTAHALQLSGLDAALGLATIDVHCGAGYYVRALARDLGASLGVPAHLHALRRTAAGPFGEPEAIALAAIVDGRAEALRRHLRPLGSLLLHLPAVTLNELQRRDVSHGRAVELPADRVVAGGPGGPVAATEGGGGSASTSHVRLIDGDGALLALALPAPGPDGRVRLQPDVVITGA